MFETGCQAESSYMSATVAAVVPAYAEEEASLDRTLRALLEQTRPLACLLVVDDASPEPVRLPGGIEGVDIVRLRRNGGLSAARNHTAALTSSDYLLL
jgi:glycosyltransferase involved in cell wall biosynthesis